MTYIIEVSHTAPTFKQFEEWGIQKAYPKFFINIIFYDNKIEVASFKIIIEGHYYCCGSTNFEDIVLSLDSYKINNITKEEIIDLLNKQNITDILEKSIEKSTKGSIIADNVDKIIEELNNF